MPRNVGSRTIDGSSMLRCMVVGLTAEQEEACRRAIVPVEIVRAVNVKDACATMSMILPLVVVIDPSLSDGERTTLNEMTTATGAEVVVLDIESPNFAGSLLEALRVAERRRLGMRP